MLDIRTLVEGCRLFEEPSSYEIVKDLLSQFVNSYQIKKGSLLLDLDLIEHGVSGERKASFTIVSILDDLMPQALVTIDLFRDGFFIVQDPSDNKICRFAASRPADIVASVVRTLSTTPVGIWGDSKRWNLVEKHSVEIEPQEPLRFITQDLSRELSF